MKEGPSSAGGYATGQTTRGETLADDKRGATSDKITVLIVEDSPIVRERLVELIAALPNVVIVGQAEEGFKAQALFRQHRPDAVVLDIRLPGINGMDLLAQFKTLDPACVVMVLTTYAYKEFRERCSALGASHFFDKSKDFERVPEILAALHTRRETHALDRKVL